MCSCSECKEQRDVGFYCNQCWASFVWSVHWVQCLCTTVLLATLLPETLPAIRLDNSYLDNSFARLQLFVLIKGDLLWMTFVCHSMPSKVFITTHLIQDLCERHRQTSPPHILQSGLSDWHKVRKYLSMYVCMQSSYE